MNEPETALEQTPSVRGAAREALQSSAIVSAFWGPNGLRAGRRLLILCAILAGLSRIDAAPGSARSGTGKRTAWRQKELRLAVTD
jgi:hypothetical protein